MATSIAPFNVRNCCNTSAPVPASISHTNSPGCKMRLIPERIMAWSSAIRTLMGKRIPSDTSPALMGWKVASPGTMIMANFEISIENALKAETGFQPDRVSNFGITPQMLREIGMLPPAEPDAPATAIEIAAVRMLTEEKVRKIYLRHFWNGCRIGDILDQELADFAMLL